MNLTTEEKTRWQAAKTPAERKVIIREVRRRARRVGDSDANIVESFVAWADRIISEQDR